MTGARGKDLENIHYVTYISCHVLFHEHCRSLMKITPQDVRDNMMACDRNSSWVQLSNMITFVTNVLFSWMTQD